MLIQTILNKVFPLKSFIYKKVDYIAATSSGNPKLNVHLIPRLNSRPICSCCKTKGPCYDTQKSREYEFIPFWGISVSLVYSPRRVNCKQCNSVKIEQLPWALGKSKLCNITKLFLAHWAKKMNWKEVATSFGFSWDAVFISVKSIVAYGLKHRSLDGIETIGVDEVKYKKGHKYLTLVYQLDNDSKRLLHIEKDRVTESLNLFFKLLNPERCQNIKVACTDMWKAYLNSIKSNTPKALNILDRFHIKKHLNEGLDKTRKTESQKLLNEKKEAFKKTLIKTQKSKSKEATKKKKFNPIHELSYSRWALLKNPNRLTEHQSMKLQELLKTQLQSVKAYLLVGDFEKFWEFTDIDLAREFLTDWISKTMTSKIEPMKEKARMLRKHFELIMNWHLAKGLHSSGVVEGLNAKMKLTVRKHYGFRELEIQKVALYHQLGKLPEPEMTHRFF